MKRTLLLFAAMLLALSVTVMAQEVQIPLEWDLSTSQSTAENPIHYTVVRCEDSAFDNCVEFDAGVDATTYTLTESVGGDFNVYVVAWNYDVMWEDSDTPGVINYEQVQESDPSNVLHVTISGKANKPKVKVKKTR